MKYSKVIIENLKQNLYKNLANYWVIQKPLDHVYDKQIGLINTIIQSYE